MTLKRLMRCHPYNNAAADDPVPQAKIIQRSNTILPFSEPLSRTLHSKFKFASSNEPANSHQSTKYKRANNS